MLLYLRRLLQRLNLAWCSKASSAMCYLNFDTAARFSRLLLLSDLHKIDVFVLDDVWSVTALRTSCTFWLHSVCFACTPRRAGTRHLELSCCIRDALESLVCCVRYRHSTTLHPPLMASLWFVDNPSLRFWSADCVVDGVLNPGSGSTGTITCTVPPSV